MVVWKILFETVLVLDTDTPLSIWSSGDERWCECDRGSPKKWRVDSTRLLDRIRCGTHGTCRHYFFFLLFLPFL